MQYSILGRKSEYGKDNPSTSTFKAALAVLLTKKDKKS